MILKRLYELAEREKLLDDPAFEELPVPWIIKLSAAGEYLGIEQRRGEITLPARKKNATPKVIPDKGKLLRVPRAHGNTANPGFARYFVDTLARVLPVSDEAKSVRSRQTFWEQLAEAADATGDPSLKAVVAFGRAFEVDSHLADTILADFEISKAALSDRCTFAWEPDVGETIIDRAGVRSWFRDLYASVLDARQLSGHQGVCQVTGEWGPVPSTHPGRFNLPGGLPGGVSLVSYDKAAFESYGLEGAANAGVGYRAADGYLRALLALIQQRLPDRPRSSLRVGSVMFLFWTREPSGGDDIMLLDRPDPAEVARLIKSVERGNRSYSSEDNQFYCLALSGNAARAIVRDYLEAPLSVIVSNLAEWFRDLQIIDDSFERQGEVHSCFPLWILAGATAREMDDVPPDLLPRMMQAALKRQPLPDSVLAACLRRLRADSGGHPFRASRMALIKLCLNRSYCQGEQRMTEALATDRITDSAYVCGRLLAFLARCQTPRDFGTSAQILERYFGSASTSPQSVLPTLLRLNRHHIAKIRSEREGFAFNLEAELDALLLPLKKSDGGTPDFPAILSLPQQGRFALGFYHQRAEYRRQAAERKQENADAE